MSQNDVGQEELRDVQVVGIEAKEDMLGPAYRQ